VRTALNVENGMQLLRKSLGYAADRKVHGAAQG